MKKQEVIHVHSLVLQAREFLIENGMIEEVEDSEYKEFGVSPTSIHRRKPKHKKALSLLFEEVNQSEETSEEEGSREETTPPAV